MQNILAVYQHWAKIDLTKDSMIDVNALFRQAAEIRFSYLPFLFLEKKRKGESSLKKRRLK